MSESNRHHAPVQISSVIRHLPAAAALVVEPEIVLGVAVVAELVDQAARRGLLEEPPLSYLKPVAAATKQVFPLNAAAIINVVTAELTVLECLVPEAARGAVHAVHRVAGFANLALQAAAHLQPHPELTGA